MSVHRLVVDSVQTPVRLLLLTPFSGGLAIFACYCGFREFVLVEYFSPKMEAPDVFLVVRGGVLGRCGSGGAKILR